MNAALAELALELPRASFQVGTDVPPRFGADSSGLPSFAPLAVIRPRSTADVATILRTCNAHGQALVVQGGLTGLSGGAVPRPGELAMSMDLLAGVERVDAQAGTMTVAAGTPLQLVQEAAAHAGFLFPLDLGARGSCQIGGNVATNAGGNRVVRYGMMRDLVLGLEAVLADGTVVSSMHSMLKNNAGFDLKHLFIGSEGVLGVVTRAVLRLRPSPRAVCAALCALEDCPSAVALLTLAGQVLGGSLSAFEAMWPPYYEQALRHAGGSAPLPPKHGMYVLIETHGKDRSREGEALEGFLETAMNDGLIVDAAVAQSEADARRLWAIRERSGEILRDWAPASAFDVGLPVARMAEFVKEMEYSLPGLGRGKVPLIFGHLGDGNLHVIAALADNGHEAEVAVHEAVYSCVRQHAGSISAEHGIGVLKRPYLSFTRTPQELAVMRTLKAALDPKGILNPGRVI